MVCHVLCPECGDCIGEVYEFINTVKQGYYSTLKHKTNIQPEKIELTSGINKPIGFILDALDIKNLCCRMHIISVTVFDKVYT